MLASSQVDMSAADINGYLMLQIFSITVLNVKNDEYYSFALDLLGMDLRSLRLPIVPEWRNTLPSFPSSWWSCYSSNQSVHFLEDTCWFRILREGNFKCPWNGWWIHHFTIFLYLGLSCLSFWAYFHFSHLAALYFVLPGNGQTWSMYTGAGTLPGRLACIPESCWIYGSLCRSSWLDMALLFKRFILHLGLASLFLPWFLKSWTIISEGKTQKKESGGLFNYCAGIPGVVI